MLIDAFTHYNPLELLKELSHSSSHEARKASREAISVSKMFPQFHDAGRRLKDMDRFGIDSQVAMVNNMVDPNMFQTTVEEQVRLCRIINEEMSELANASRGRVATLGTVPLAARDEGGPEEMERAVKSLGLKGFMVLTNLGGRSVDEVRWFWDEVERLGVAVYIHPGDPFRNRRVTYEDEFELSRVFGWPYETAITVMRLVLKGIMAEHPSLNVVTHHMGGMIPFLSGRIGEWYTKAASPLNRSRLVGAKVSGQAIDQLRKFYYDTTVGGSLSALRCGYEVFGAKRIVFATDYPWGPGGGRGRLATYPGLVRRLGLLPRENEDIFENNIRRILDV